MRMGSMVQTSLKRLRHRPPRSRPTILLLKILGSSDPEPAPLLTDPRRPDPGAEPHPGSVAPVLHPVLAAPASRRPEAARSLSRSAPLVKRTGHIQQWR